MAISLETAGSKFTSARPADLQRLAALLREPTVRRYLCDDVILSDDDITAMIARSAASAANGRGMWMLEGRDGALAGVIAADAPTGVMAQVDGIAGQVEVLIAMSPGHARRGLATQALERLTTYARDDLGLPRLVGAVDAPNEASHRLMARAGFVPFGTHPGPAHVLTLYRKEL